MSEVKEDTPRLEIAKEGFVGGDGEKEEPKDGVVAQADSSTNSRFKLEVIYDGNFSIHKPNLGVICLWGTGGDNMPYADWKIYFCPREGCIGLITPGSHGQKIAACPMCKTAWLPKQLHGEYLYVMTVDKWAKRIADYLNRIGNDADIYLKRFKTNLSIIEADKQERMFQKGGELLNAARQAEAAVYTRDRLIKDTLSGASLEACVKAFLLA